jgi:RimJ/RimL family protein N-acetyltransferase
MINAMTDSTWIKPITLTGQHVVLEPLAEHHCDDLSRAVTDGELWRLWVTSVPAPDQVEDYMTRAFAMRDQLGAQPFAVRQIASGKVVGCTRLFNLDPANRRLEIGHTWYARSVQRTAVNTETKLLLLTHCFESLDTIAVEFRTHFMNHASRAAIARLGARQDGILRQHQVMSDGSYRDTVVFSIINSEWPTVRRHLRFKLEPQPC